MTAHQLRRELHRDIGRLGGPCRWLLFRCLPSLLFTLLLLLLLPLAPARAEEPDPAAGSGVMWLRDAAGAYTPAALQDSRVHFDIAGMIATVTLRQRFRNASEGWLEGVYAFPLPEGAAVRRLQMEVGERRIEGRIRERVTAQAIYQQAKQAGRRASLVEQQRPNLFTSRVANIGPGEAIVVELEYVQQAGYGAGRFSLRFPMTITPRYLPGAALPPAGGEGTLTIDPYLGWGVATDQVPDGAAITPLQLPQPGTDSAPRNPIAITARLDMGMPLAAVESPYHDIALARSKGVYQLQLAAGVAEMDRDFVLSWQPVTGSEPGAALFTEPVAGENFGMLLLLPPAPERAAAPPPREMVFVVDTSGSMGGVSIRQAREALAEALRQLRPVDSFNIIAFDSGLRPLYRQAMPASRHHLQQAAEFVRQLQASGGTEMLPALEAALAPADGELYREQRPLRQVVFITDGAVGNEAALFAALSAQLGDSRLFTVGIGAAPNSWFMRKAAEFGRGTHTHIGAIGEVRERMNTLFAQLSRPAAVNLRVHWPQPVEAWPQRLPDLYLGEPLTLAVNFGSAPPGGEIRIEGELAGRPWQRSLRLQETGDPQHLTGHRGVASLWARRKIDGLLDQVVTGRAEPEVRAAVLPLALEHQLLSPYTSFVAVEEVVARPAGERVGSAPVPNSRPRGQSDQGFAWPRTATTGPARAWCGALLLCLALLVWVMGRPEVDHVPARQA